jgi:hypothetical protein
MAKDEREVPRTEEERVMRRLLDRGMACKWEAAENGRKIVYEGPLRLNEFSEMMMRRSTVGYALGAQLFLQAVTVKGVERAVRSHLLTQLARSMHDSSESPVPITEPEVAMFGHFVAELIGESPEMFVAWAEDMNVDDPQNDFQKQPTAVIRGVFLSSAVIQKKGAAQFWELASRSRLFPLRVFSSPCEPKHGTLFAPFHVRAFSAIFDAVSRDAAEHFARHMRKRASVKLRNVPVSDGVWKQRLLRVSRGDRQAVFRAITDGIPSGERRRAVAAVLGVVTE